MKMSDQNDIYDNKLVGMEIQTHQAPELENPVLESERISLDISCPKLLIKDLKKKKTYFIKNSFHQSY